MFGMISLGPIQAFITEWGLMLAAIVCVLAAIAAFSYIPIAGRPIAAVLVALAAGMASYDLGYQARGALDSSGAIQAQLDEVNRQIMASKIIAYQASARDAATAAAASQQQGLLDAYETQLAARGESVGCRLNSDDVRSLRGIGSANPPEPPRRPGNLRPASSGP